jgi:signal transduction histidine kinase
VELLARELGALGTLLDHVAHDLRNSLGSVLGFVQLLSPKVTDELRPWLARIEQRTRDAVGLTALLPAFAPAPITRTAPRPILRRAARALAARARARGVRLHVEAAGGDSPDVEVCEPLVDAALRSAVIGQLATARRGDVISLVARATTGGVDLEVSRDRDGASIDPLARLLAPTLGAQAAGISLELSRRMIAYGSGSLEVLRGGARVLIRLRAAPIAATP